jgi:protein-disulfide isomerase
LRRVPQLVLGAVIGALVAACSPACNPPDARAPGSDPSVEAGGKRQKDPTVAAHDEKRKQLPQDEMLMEAPGVDTSRLSEAQRGVFFQVINTEPSACDKPHSMARSLVDDPGCRDSQLAAQFVADALASGHPASAVKHDLPLVVDALSPREIDITGRPVYGSERAPVTVVVFADFQCPHCRAEAPVLRKAVDQFRGRAKLVYKHFPLAGHDRAKVAAIATEAAHEQGKFWEMHDLVFENQHDLTDANIRKWAQQIGLDMAKFDASFKAQKGRAVVEKDKADGEAIEISGTPAVYVNGRQVIPALFGGSVTAWIDDALKR